MKIKECYHVSWTPNISAKTWSNCPYRGCFENVRTSRFQICPLFWKFVGVTEQNKIFNSLCQYCISIYRWFKPIFEFLTLGGIFLGVTTNSKNFRNKKNSICFFPDNFWKLPLHKYRSWIFPLTWIWDLELQIFESFQQCGPRSEIQAWHFYKYSRASVTTCYCMYVPPWLPTSVPAVSCCCYSCQLDPPAPAL